MESEFTRVLKKITDGAGTGLQPEALEQCGKYYALLIQENKKYNLTTITGPTEAAEKHFLDSMLLLPDLEEYNQPSMVDVGSGAGFPGLPLKICRPDIQMTFMDSVGKKIAFIAMVIKKLGLEGTKTVHTRAEEHAAGYKEYYDIAVSRAVAEARVLMELTLPLVRVGGRVVISKGPGVEDELKAAENAVKTLGGEVERVREFFLPVSGDKRAVVRIAKVRSTPEKYPRRPGMPAKRPL